MPAKDLGVIAELVAVYACTSRHDLREAACSGAWDGAWQELALDKHLDLPSVADPAVTCRERVQEFLNSDGAASFRQANSFVDLAWSPPCPGNRALNMMFWGAAVAEGLDP